MTRSHESQKQELINVSDHEHITFTMMVQTRKPSRTAKNHSACIFSRTTLCRTRGADLVQFIALISFPRIRSSPMQSVLVLLSTRSRTREQPPTHLDRDDGKVTEASVTHRKCVPSSPPARSSATLRVQILCHTSPSAASLASPSFVQGLDVELFFNVAVQEGPFPIHHAHSPRSYPSPSPRFRVRANKLAGIEWLEGGGVNFCWKRVSRKSRLTCLFCSWHIVRERVVHASETLGEPVMGLNGTFVIPESAQ